MVCALIWRWQAVYGSWERYRGVEGDRQDRLDTYHELHSSCLDIAWYFHFLIRPLWFDGSLRGRRNVCNIFVNKDSFVIGNLDLVVFYSRQILACLSFTFGNTVTVIGIVIILHNEIFTATFALTVLYICTSILWIQAQAFLKLSEYYIICPR